MKLFTFLMLLSSLAMAQTAQLTGLLQDAKDNSPVVGVSIRLTSLDSTNQILKGTASDVDGTFKINDIPFGEYQLETIFLGYVPAKQKITIKSTLQVLPTIRLEIDNKVLDQVEIKGTAVRVEQLGDTTQFNANAYKVNKDATVEDLVKKMPGITIENGTLKSQGEDVKKVLIDGKEFFGEDAMMALKNLAADVVDKIQTFDRPSDQARFTGFDDGNSQRGINIVTKNGMKNAKFGKLYGGYGYDTRYNVGGNVNIFKNDRRVSVVGQTNNINQQNFSSQDLIGISGSGGQQRGGGGNPPRGGGMPQPQGDYYVNAQNGIATTNALGLNYTDKWGKKVNVTSSNFLNWSSTNSNGQTSKQFFTKDTVAQLYTESKQTLTNNLNYRFNSRFEINLDSNNAMIWTPKINIQNNDIKNTLEGINTLGEDSLSSLTNNSPTFSKVYNVNNTLLYLHKLRKKGRSVSATVSNDISNKTGRNKLYSLNKYYLLGDSSSLYDQKGVNSTNSQTHTGVFTYLEPINKSSFLAFNYMPSISIISTEKLIDNVNPITNEYTLFDSTFSNTYENTITKQAGSVGYNFVKNKLTFESEARYQYTHMQGKLVFPNTGEINKTFNNFLPMLRVIYAWSKTKSLRTRYRTATESPSITQLQGVVDNSNSLLLTTGNPDLKQQYTHTLFGRFANVTPDKGKSFALYFMSNLTQNYIGTSTYISTADTNIGSNIILRKGSQLSKPTNLSGYVNVRSFANYSFPVKKFKSNMSVNASVALVRTPGLINNQSNFSTTLANNIGFTISSNISDKLDFTIITNGTYNIVTNKLNPQRNNNYYFHNSSFKINYVFSKGLFVNGEANNTIYTGLGPGYDQNFTLVNLALGKKLFAKENGEIKLSVFDLLNQNNYINRTITETYVENNSVQILRQYYMLTFTYTFRKFGKREEDSK